jgi:diguanylate cyclase (GGDEF)-like protein/putative nucleotidyltransferase with HDIG domain
MAWLDWVFIGTVIVIAGALIGLRPRARFLYSPGHPLGLMIPPPAPNETALTVPSPSALARRYPAEEAIAKGPTGLRPKDDFLEALERERHRSTLTGRRFSLMIMALDRFEQLNHRLGRREADRALSAAAALLAARSTPPRVAARYGPDEFALLMPDTDTPQAGILAEELRGALEADTFLRTREVTGSFGIVTFPDHGRGQEEILRLADWGISLARRCGGNCVKAASLGPTPEDAERDQRLLEACLGAGAQGALSTAVGTSGDERDGLLPMNSLFDTISALAFAVGTKGPYVNDHSQAVSRLAAQIAIQAGLSPAEIEEIHVAGTLHDIGKLHVPEHVLRKPSRLTAEEYEIMKSHPAWGATMLEPLKAKSIELIVRHHHERYDGKGYPDGLAGDQIPLGARIVAVAECFHNMLSGLRYKSPRTFQDALAELRRCSGTQFDPQVVTAFLEWIQTQALQSDPELH